MSEDSAVTAAELMSEAEIKKWIWACNSLRARAVLQDYLALRKQLAEVRLQSAQEFGEGLCREGELLIEIEALRADNAKKDAALRKARETVLSLVNARDSEAEGTDEQWVSFIDAALTPASQEADHVADAGKMVPDSAVTAAELDELQGEKRPKVYHLGAALQEISDTHAAVLTPRQREALYQAASKLWEPASPSPGLREQIAENANCSGLREAVIEECAKAYRNGSGPFTYDYFDEAEATIRALSRPVSEREGQQ